MNKTRSLTFAKILITLLIICLLFENIKLFDFLGAPVKLSHLVVTISIVFCLCKTKISKRRLLVCLFFSILPILPIFRIIDLLEWFKSYAIWEMIVLFFTFCFPLFHTIVSSNFRYFKRIICFVFLLAETLGIVQFIFVNIFNVSFLINPFGQFQFHESYFNYFHGYMRCFSVFHEPSVLGWVSSSFIYFLIFWRNKKMIKRKWFLLFSLISLISTICSFSSSALYFVLLAAFFDFLINIKKLGSWLYFISFVIFIFIISISTDVLSPMLRIFTEFGVEGTSGFERLNSPFEYSIKTLTEYPLFGRGIGQDDVADYVGHINGTITSTANNSFFEIIQNLGLSSIFVFALLFGFFVMLIKNDKTNILLCVSISCVLICTGAYLSLDFLVILFVTLILAKPVYNKSSIFLTKRKNYYELS